MAAFLKACELQERCKGLRLREFIVMPLQVGIFKPKNLKRDTASNLIRLGH